MFRRLGELIGWDWAGGRDIRSGRRAWKGIDGGRRRGRADRDGIRGWGPRLNQEWLDKGIMGIWTIGRIGRI